MSKLLIVNNIYCKYPIIYKDPHTSSALQIQHGLDLLLLNCMHETLDNHHDESRRHRRDIKWPLEVVTNTVRSKETVIKLFIKPLHHYCLVLN